MDETDAVEALQRLGLSKYEASVFIALQKLGTGTARDITRVADVPRSQVYGTAESLEERGLIEVQESKPRQFRAVSLDEARARLQTRLEREQDRAFEFLETVHGAHRNGEEEQEAIWTIHGRETVTNRVEQIIHDAETRVIHAVDDELLEDRVVEALEARAANGVQVTVLSGDQAVLDRLADAEGVTAAQPPNQIQKNDQHIGRLLVVDGDTVLLSVLGDEQLGGVREETAIWSTETGLASVLIQLLAGPLGDRVDF